MSVGLAAKGEYKRIPLDQLELWRDGNVRKSGVYEDVPELAQNIRQVGLQNPLVVKEEKPNEKYLVISGQRRLQACRMANLSPVPCIVLKKISLEDAKLASLSENLYRRAMNADDISDACDYLYQRYGSVSKVAERLGVAEPTVRKYLGYKNVPEELKELVREKSITPSQAIFIYSQFRDRDRQVKVAKELASISKRTERSQFFQAVTESLPSDDLTAIKERAKKRAQMVEFTILLPPKTSSAIKKVANEMSVEAEYVIVEILESYVSDRVSKGLPLIA